MEKRKDPLNSAYIIDGQRNEVTPAQMLHQAMTWASGQLSDEIPLKSEGEIVDESIDTPPVQLSYEFSKAKSYAEACAKLAKSMQDRDFDLIHPEFFSKTRIAAALIDTLWLKGSFRLEDLALWIDWKWECETTGNMAAFYDCIRSSTDYIYDLGVQLSGYVFEADSDICSMSCFPALADDGFDEDEQDEEIIPDKDWEEDDIEVSDTKMWIVSDNDAERLDERQSWMGEERSCPTQFVKESGSLILYIPFDSCSFKLGGSLFSEIAGGKGGLAPKIADPDYFMDCYEIVREFSEDGLLLSARTVCDGGIATAALKMCGASAGAELCLRGLQGAYQDNDNIQLLFSELPGALIQVSKKDIEYIDTQMLLQDVAYYKIGVVCSDSDSLRFLSESGNGIGGILASLLSEAYEGED